MPAYICLDIFSARGFCGGCVLEYSIALNFFSLGGWYRLCLKWTFCPGSPSGVESVTVKLRIAELSSALKQSLDDLYESVVK